MNQPTECKHCGLHATWHIDEDTFFACGTIYAGRGDYWNQSTGCVEIMQSRERIQQAVELLKGAERFDCEALDGSTCRERHDGGGEVDADVVDQVIEILKCNSSKSLNSSPVTTDDLAASDYYEAVRQRVPWMVAVEHIEGLVEGYRQCGVAVWQTADEIRKVHGGEHGKAN